MDYLIVDFSNIASQILYSIPTLELKDDDYALFKYKLVNTFTRFVKKFNSRTIFALEGGDNWRKKIFPGYKADRANKRAKSGIDFKDYYKMLDDFIKNLRKIIYKAKFIEVPCAEADDVIGVLVKHIKGNVTVISTDTDFYQLYKYPGYKQFNPRTNSFIEVTNSTNFLLAKVLKGDKSDNIPNVRPKIGLKTANAIVEHADLNAWLKKEGLTERFDLNYKLISFDAIPKEIEDEIINAYNSYKHEKTNIMSYLMAAGLTNILSEIPDLTKSIEFDNTELK